MVPGGPLQLRGLHGDEERGGHRGFLGLLEGTSASTLHTPRPAVVLPPECFPALGHFLVEVFFLVETQGRQLTNHP